MSPEAINEYIRGLLAKASSEEELLQLDKDGLGLLLRVNPEFDADDPNAASFEDAWSASVTALGEALDGIMTGWSEGTLNAKKEVEDAIAGITEAANTASIEQTAAMTTAATDGAQAMVDQATLKAPLALNAWKTGLINPLSTAFTDLGTQLSGIMVQAQSLGNLGIGGIGGVGGISNTSNRYTNVFNNNRITGRGGVVQLDSRTLHT